MRRPLRALAARVLRPVRSCTEATGAWHLAVNGVAMWPVWTTRQRAAWLRLCGLRIGTGTLVQPCHLGSPRLSIGEWSYVGPGCVVDGRAEVRIGSRVALGDQVLLVTSTHDHSDPTLRAGTPGGLPVVVEDGAWLGARVTVLPGVRVGTGCVVAAGAVVHRDCAPHGLYAGVPARRVKDLPTEAPELT
jgi:maltose O-acetyltransferase